MKRAMVLGWVTLVLGIVTAVLGGVVMGIFDGEIIVMGFTMMMLGCGLLGTGASILVHPEDWD